VRRVLSPSRVVWVDDASLVALELAEIAHDPLVVLKVSDSVLARDVETAAEFRVLVE